MAKVKVYVPTFRRHGMLPRALESLRFQTFKDWICEVHNDDPNDRFPEELVVTLADPRIKIVNHPVNLGGAATMNAFYAPVPEEFVSILEDDNWWEPEFLEEMLRAAEKHPHVTVFWANMKLWQENEDGSFQFTGKTIHPGSNPACYQEIWWPDVRQVIGAVHSNGACLIRSSLNSDYRIPKVPFTAIEMFRERMFPQPLVFIQRPLANFSMTILTERSKDSWAWAEAQAVLGATFFAAARWSRPQMRAFFDESRNKKPPCTHTLLNAALLEPSCRDFFEFATSWEKTRWILSLLKRPAIIFALLRSRTAHPAWWEFLQKNTEKRFSESRLRLNKESIIMAKKG